jgi:hypothetical protein
MAKKPQVEQQHVPGFCACDLCFVPDPEAQARAAAWWRQVEERLREHEEEVVAS